MAVDAYDNLGEVREGNEHVPESRMTHEHCEFGIYAMIAPTPLPKPLGKGQAEKRRVSAME